MALRVRTGAPVVLGWSSLVVAGLLALIAGPLLLGPPSAAEYSAGAVRWMDGRIALAASLALPGLAAAACAVLVAPLRRCAGAFGAVAAAVLAVALASLLTLASPLPRAAALAAAWLGALLASPLLRERGALSLALIALPIATLGVFARRSALSALEAAQELAALRQVVLEQTHRHVCVGVPKVRDVGFRLGLVWSLQTPNVASALDVTALPEDAPELELLRSAGHPLVAVRDGAVRVDAGGGLPQRAPAPAAARLVEDRGPVVVPQPAQGRWTLRVVTPVAAFARTLDDPTHGLSLSGDDLRAYQSIVRALPTGVPILVRVEGPGFADGSDWSVLRR
jgi:hypothetical protein